jgi:hypothetical protein
VLYAKAAELMVSPAAPGFAQREGTINRAALATIRNSGKISFPTVPQPAEGVAAILRLQHETKAPQFAVC